MIYKEEEMPKYKGKHYNYDDEGYNEMMMDMAKEQKKEMIKKAMSKMPKDDGGHEGKGIIKIAIMLNEGSSEDKFSQKAKVRKARAMMEE